MEEAKQYIKNIALNGTPAQKRALYAFNSETSEDKILKKFKIWANTNLHRYFKKKPAPFHDAMIRRTIRSYRGGNINELGYRGCAKTTLKKLLRAYLILNDEDHSRKYIKILCRELGNAKQIVTDIYNICVELEHIYGDIFIQEGKKKTEETMSAFDTKDGVKVRAGSVGQAQRGHLQDAFRPDWLWFEDIEDSETITSQVLTANIISKCDEAINGMSMDGCYELTGNYISDGGSVQWFIDKEGSETSITPIMIDDLPTWDAFTREDIRILEKNALDFWGEYMCDPNRSKNKFFDIERIEQDMKRCVEPKLTSGSVKYWSTYQPHHRYGQASDHSEGIGRDSNTLIGFDFNTGEQIYSYANNIIAPDLACYEFARVGSEFGNCIYAPEINNKCGGVVLKTLVSIINYPRIYKQKRHEKGSREVVEKVGWETNKKTKYTAFFEFKRDYNDGLIKINDVELLKEMKAYTNPDLSEDDSVGLVTRHFDLLMAAVIAWQMKNEDQYSAPDDDYEYENDILYPDIGI